MLRRASLSFVLLISSLSLAPRSAAATPATEWVVGAHKKIAILTFEGGTTEPRLRRLLDDLRQNNAKASFFLRGTWVGSHRRGVRIIRRAGHAIGNGGWDGESFTAMTNDEISTSLERTARRLRRMWVYPRPFARPPRGDRDARVLRALAEAGYRSTRWSVRARDGLARRVARKVMRQIKYGSIISFDLRRVSHRHAAAIVARKLKRRGFDLKSVEALKWAHPVSWDVVLKSGSSGREVTHLQKWLRWSSYAAGAVDGSFGYSTLEGVYAFQKTHGFVRDGVVTPPEMEAIARLPRPHVRKKTSGRFVDVDISRQVLFEVRKGKVVHTLPVSSGNEEYYTVDGDTRKAHTPRGNFVVERKIPGWRTSDLGRLWYPSYFVGGYAIHGSTSVPTYPASHGCVRIPMYATKGFYYRNPIGTPVFVHN